MNLSSEFAALCTFRAMLDENKSYDNLIDDFVEFSIIYNGYSNFDSPRIQKDILEEFNFDKPISIIKGSLRKFVLNGYLKRNEKDGFYMYAFSKEKESEFKKLIQDYEREKQSNEEENNKLFEYLQRKVELTDEIKSKSLDIFRSLILGIDDFHDDNKGLVESIGCYILQRNEQDSNLGKSWVLLKTSVIIREALLYDNDLITEKFKNLTIFLDMEVLFDCYGLNGSIYKQLFNDFYKLVEILNSKGCNIHLKYFDYTYEDIESYFSMALRIFDNRSVLYPATTAMENIVNGVSNRSLIIEKKAEFYNCIDCKGISKFLTYLYIDSAKKTKISGERDISEDNDAYVYRHEKGIMPLRLIKAMRRGSVNTKLTDVEFILMTRTRIFKQYALSDRKKANEIPLAVDTDYLVNRFWFACGKGLSDVSVDITSVPFIQRMLSEDKRMQIFQKFNELKAQENKSDIDIKDIKLRIQALKTIENLPESINANSFDQSVEDEIEALLESKENLSFEKIEHEKTKNELKQQQEEKEAISLELEKQIQEKNEVESKNRVYQEKNKNMEHKVDSILIEIETELSDLHKNKKQADETIPRKFRKYSLVIKIVCFLICLAIPFFIFFKVILPNWNEAEAWVSWFIPVVADIVLFFILYIFLKKIPTKENLIKRIENKFYDKYQQRYYKKHNINIERIKKLEEQKKLLEQ